MGWKKFCNIFLHMKRLQLKKRNKLGGKITWYPNEQIWPMYIARDIQHAARFTCLTDEETEAKMEGRIRSSRHKVEIITCISGLNLFLFHCKHLLRWGKHTNQPLSCQDRGGQDGYAD